MRRGQQPPLQHALVEFGGGNGARLSGLAEMWFERNRIEGDEAVDEALDFSGVAKESDLRPAVGDDREILDGLAKDLTHD